MESNLRMISIPNLFKSICLSDDNQAAVETYQQVIYVIDIQTGEIIKKINLKYFKSKISGLYALQKNILIFENGIVRMDNLKYRPIVVPIQKHFIFDDKYIMQDLLNDHQLEHQFSIDQNITSQLISKIDHTFITNKYQFLRKNNITKFKDKIIKYVNAKCQTNETQNQQGYNSKQFIEYKQQKAKLSHNIKLINKFKIIRVHKLTQKMDYDYANNGLQCYFSQFYTEEFKNIIKWRVIQFDLITQKTSEIICLQGVGLKQVVCNKQFTLITHDNKIYIK